MFEWNAGSITILVTLATYLLMVIAFRLPHRPLIHRPIMACVIAYDVIFPFYLVSSRDFYGRLIEHQEILSFGVWMHLMVVVVLYFLYFFQVSSAIALSRDSTDTAAREAHRSQAKGILIARAFVIFTGTLLYDPQYLDSDGS